MFYRDKHEAYNRLLNSSAQDFWDWWLEGKKEITFINPDDYELKPEVKKRRLEAQIKNHELTISSLTNTISETQRQLDKAKEELKRFGK